MQNLGTICAFLGSKIVGKINGDNSSTHFFSLPLRTMSRRDPFRIYYIVNGGGGVVEGCM